MAIQTSSQAQFHPLERALHRPLRRPRRLGGVRLLGDHSGPGSRGRGVRGTDVRRAELEMRGVLWTLIAKKADGTITESEDESLDDDAGRVRGSRISPAAPAAPPEESRGVREHQGDHRRTTSRTPRRNRRPATTAGSTSGSTSSAPASSAPPGSSGSSSADGADLAARRRRLPLHARRRLRGRRDRPTSTCPSG